MAKLIIEGGHRLTGEVTVSGSKNAVLPILAAALLADGECLIENAPNLSDVETLGDILRGLGAQVTRTHNTLVVNASKVSECRPDPALVGNLRGSILVMGPLLARLGCVTVPHPGGDRIGPRPIDTHLKALEGLGAKTRIEGSFYHLESARLKGNKVVLDELSVTATENLLMASVLATGVTEIRLAAAEPEVVNLAEFLKSMGAKIEGEGTHTIRVEGVEKLNGGRVRIMPDRLEAATLAVAAAVTQGDVLIHGFMTDHLDAVVNKLREANVSFESEGENLKVTQRSFLRALNIRTDIYPGFPTDLQAPFAVLLTQAAGTSLIFETLYAGRLNYGLELLKMGANITLLDQHRLQIVGPTPLQAKEIDSLDIRAGATLVLASLIASGRSSIGGFELVDRGYERIDEKLQRLGAKLRRVEEGNVPSI